MKHQEPYWLKDWRAAVDKWPPKCCHTCSNYTEDGICEIHDTQPPADFAAEVDKCNSWLMDVPF